MTARGLEDECFFRKKIVNGLRRSDMMSRNSIIFENENDILVTHSVRHSRTWINV